jgi:hypothetical protein
MCEIKRTEISNNMSGLESIKAIVLLKEPFSVKNGLLTLTWVMLDSKTVLDANNVHLVSNLNAIKQ